MDLDDLTRLHCQSMARQKLAGIGLASWVQIQESSCPCTADTHGQFLRCQIAVMGEERLGRRWRGLCLGSSRVVPQIPSGPWAGPPLGGAHGHCSWVCFCCLASEMMNL